MVGWGEGLELAGQAIQAREGDHCDDVTIALFYYPLANAFPCGTRVRPTTPADYRVLYVNERQRMTPAEVAAVRASGRLVDVIRVRGIDYAEIYDERLPSDGSTP